MPFQFPDLFQFIPIWLLVLFLAVVFALVLLRPRKRRWRPPQDYPYARRPALFSQGELVFLRALQEAAPHLAVYGKLRLEDIIAVRKGAANYSSARGYIRSRHIDFVLCDRQTTAIVCALELDDRTHRRDSARQVDEFKNKALAAAGVPLLRVTAARHYDPAAIAKLIEDRAISV